MHPSMYAPDPPSQFWADVRKTLLHRLLWRKWYHLRGLQYEMKINVAIRAVAGVLPCLNLKLDRVAVSVFATDFRVILAPCSDPVRIQKALKSVLRAATRVGPRGSCLFNGIGHQLHALEAHSPDRAQLNLVMTDGADNSSTTAAVAGRAVGAYCDRRPGEHNFMLVGCGQDGALDYSQLGQFRVAAGDRCLTLLDDIYGLAPVVRRALYRATATLTGVTVATEDVSLQLLRASLQVERRGIDVCICFDVSPSMNGYAVGPSEQQGR